jgi:O-antigen ligase
VTWITSCILALVPLVYWSNLRDYTLPPKLLVFQVGLMVLYAYWIKWGPRSISLTSAGLPALAYLIANIVSLHTAYDPVAGLLEITRVLSGLLLFIALANLLSPSQLPGLLRVWLVTTVVISALGIVQHLGFRPFHMPSAGFPSATLGFRNIAAMYLIQSLPFAVAFLAISKTRRDRILSGIALSAMTVFLVYTRTRGAWVGLLVAIYSSVGLWTLGSLHRNRRTLYLCLFLLNPALLGGILGAPVLIGMELPFKNATWVVISISLCAWLWLTISHQMKIRTIPVDAKRIGLILGIAVITIFLALLPTRLPKIGPQSVDEKKADLSAAVSSLFSEDGGRGRKTMWRHTVSMFSESPVFGVGPGNWSVHYPRFDRGDRVTFGAAPERPHNDLLWILSETGLPGLLCYLWLAISVLRRAWGLLQSHSERVRWLAAACLTGLLAITIHSLFSFPKERITPTVFFWVAVGLLYVLEPRQKSSNRKKNLRPVLVVAVILISLQILFTIKVVGFEHEMKHAVSAERRTDWKGVAGATEKALMFGAFHPEVVHLRGYALNQIGEFESSRGLYTEALHRRPYDIQMLNGMAIACQNLGLDEEAIAHYLRALDTIPDLADVCFNLAGLYARMGNLDEAIQTFLRTIELRSNDAQSYYALGELFSRTNRTGDAIQAYKAFIHHWNGDPRYNDIARNRIKQLSSENPQQDH